MLSELSVPPALLTLREIHEAQERHEQLSREKTQAALGWDLGGTPIPSSKILTD